MVTTVGKGSFKLTHISAEDKVAWLSGLEYQSFGRIIFQLANDLFELGKNLSGQAVTFLVGPVEGEPGRFVYIRLNSPMEEVAGVFAFAHVVFLFPYGRVW
jgi:hypothetical protein